MAVELLVSLTAVSQLAAAFLCGCCIFQERSTVMQQVGFVTWQKMGRLILDEILDEQFSGGLFGGMMERLCRRGIQTPILKSED